MSVLSQVQDFYPTVLMATLDERSDGDGDGPENQEGGEDEEEAPYPYQDFSLPRPTAAPWDKSSLRTGGERLAQTWSLRR